MNWRATTTDDGNVLLVDHDRPHGPELEPALVADFGTASSGDEARCRIAAEAPALAEALAEILVAVDQVAEAERLDSERIGGSDVRLRRAWSRMQRARADAAEILKRVPRFPVVLRCTGCGVKENLEHEFDCWLGGRVGANACMKPGLRRPPTPEIEYSEPEEDCAHERCALPPVPGVGFCELHLPTRKRDEDSCPDCEQPITSGIDPELCSNPGHPDNAQPEFDDEEPPEPDDAFGECRHCGATFPGTGDDCGGCRLDDEQALDYVRRSGDRS